MLPGNPNGVTWAEQKKHREGKTLSACDFEPPQSGTLFRSSDSLRLPQVVQGGAVLMKIRWAAQKFTSHGRCDLHIPMGAPLVPH